MLGLDIASWGLRLAMPDGNKRNRYLIQYGKQIANNAHLVLAINYHISAERFLAANPYSERS